jgi:hypothetical protein
MRQVSSEQILIYNDGLPKGKRPPAGTGAWNLKNKYNINMTLQAWHTCNWGVSPILPCRSSQALSGWIGSIAAQLFSSLSRDLNRVQVRALAGPLKDIQRLVLVLYGKFLRTHGLVFALTCTVNCGTL